MAEQLTVAFVHGAFADSSSFAGVIERLQNTTGNGGTATEFALNPAKAREAFAYDLTEDQAAVVAAVQRPVSELAFSEQSGPPAWKSPPSWAVVATGDKAAGTDVVRAH